VKARAFRFGTGRLGRLSLVRTRRGGAMMVRCHTDASAVRSGRGRRHFPAAAGRHEPDCHNADRCRDGSAGSRQGAPELEVERPPSAYKVLPPSDIAGQISNTAHRGGVAVILSERGSS
jgi:hypothetical protein